MKSVLYYNRPEGQIKKGKKEQKMKKLFVLLSEYYEIYKEGRG